MTGKGDARCCWSQKFELDFKFPAPQDCTMTREKSLHTHSLLVVLNPVPLKPGIMVGEAGTWASGKRESAADLQKPGLASRRSCEFKQQDSHL